MTAKETLEKFFETLKKEDVTYDQVIGFIQLTQKEESKLVGKNDVHAHINGIKQLVNVSKDIKLKEKFTTNKIKKDFVVTFFSESKVKMACRLIKESDIRKTSPDGTWGVNISSFRLIKK